MTIPLSVPTHLYDIDPAFWTPLPADFAWPDLKQDRVHAISGSAFIDLVDPYGPMGNPFAVVIGSQVEDFDDGACSQIAQLTHTPETVFIRNCRPTGKNIYRLLLTVLTPTGKELGACAHGFTGAIRTLLDCGQVVPNSEITLSTTLGTTAKVFVSAVGIIAIEFIAQEPRMLAVPHQTVNDVFRTEVLLETTDFPILSVGSPKLTIEVTPDVFAAVQANLRNLDYDTLLAFQDKERINGIHMFCRSAASQQPEKAIQVNAYLGKDYVIDLATGVSAAGQIAADSTVAEGTEVTITQYTAKGPSAILKVTKQAGKVRVGGTAVLFNHRELTPDEEVTW